MLFDVTRADHNAAWQFARRLPGVGAGLDREGWDTSIPAVRAVLQGLAIAGFQAGVCYARGDYDPSVPASPEAK